MKNIILLYSIILSFFSFFTYAYVDINLPFFNTIFSGLGTQKRELFTILYVLFMFVLFAFYLFFLKLSLQKKLSYEHFKNIVIIQIAALFFSYPAIFSFDIFNYIFSAKVAYYYFENPYVIMPIEFLGDPYLAFTHAPNKIALYGPIWLILSSIPFYLGFGNLLLTVFTYKAFVALFYLGCIFFIRRLSTNLTSVAIFALNPLVVIETLVSGHNDVVMMFFALCAFLLIFKKRYATSLIFLVFSILVKYATIFLLPVYLYSLVKDFFKKKLNPIVIFNISALSMLIIFLLSPIREEIYPWYAIWVLTFLCLGFNNNKKIILISSAFSLGLMLRYVPFMLIGTYFGITPILKIFFTFCLPLIIILIFYLTHKIWKKNIFA